MTPPAASGSQALALRPPWTVHAFACLIGATGALAPAFVTSLFEPFQDSREILAVAAIGTLAVHAGLHAFSASGEMTPGRFVVSTLAPGIALALASSILLILATRLRAAGYAAFIANAAASTIDVWEAGKVVRLRPASVWTRNGRLECRLTLCDGEAPASSSGDTRVSRSP
jgi:hypothetical protein